MVIPDSSAAGQSVLSGVPAAPLSSARHLLLRWTLPLSASTLPCTLLPGCFVSTDSVRLPIGFKSCVTEARLPSTAYFLHALMPELSGLAFSLTSGPSCPAVQNDWSPELGPSVPVRVLGEQPVAQRAVLEFYISPHCTVAADKNTVCCKMRSVFFLY